MPFRAAFLLLVIAMAVSVAAVHPSNAQTGTVGLTKEEAESKRQAEQRRLDEAEEERLALEASTGQLAAERGTINAQMIGLGAKIKATEANLTRLEEELAEQRGVERAKKDILKEKHGQIGRILLVLQRMGRNPPPVLVTQRSDALSQVRSAMLLTAIYPGLREEATAISTEVGALVAAIDGMDKARAELATQKASYDEDQRQLDELLLVKREEIKKNEARIEVVEEFAKKQAKTVANLDELIRKLDKAVALKGTLGEYERELAAGTAPGQKTSGAPTVDIAAIGKTAPETTTDEAWTPKSSPDTSSAPEASTLVNPSATASPTVAFMSPSRIKPAVPFENAKGRLPLPVEGQSLYTFGDQTPHGTRSRGAAFATRAGAQITSPCDGWVVYAGEFRSYGQLLIINAGGSYHTVLAGMAQINVAVGQFVLMGEPVGKMGQSRAAAEGSGKKEPPIFYVEFRHKERPIDPGPWWARDTSKVQG